MILSVVLVVFGLGLLFAGGELLVRGASRLAERAGISPAVVGLTVVAAGTSAPELVVSIGAAWSGSTDVAVGNVVGSNIFNIGAILGIAALIRPLRIQGNSVRLEWPVMLAASCLLYVLARDGAVDRLEGALFVLLLVLFIGYVVRLVRRDLTRAEGQQLAEQVAAEAEAAEKPWPVAAALVVGGCALLVAGAECLVRGSVAIAMAAGLSETTIGLTVVAAGTSLPELATSAVASLRGRDDVAVANVIGSNIFNVLGILGATALIHPLPIVAGVLSRDCLWMLGFSLALFPLMKSGLRIARVEGALLLAVFGGYLVVVLSS